MLSDPIRLKILMLLKEGRQETYQSPICSVIPTAVCPADPQLVLDKISPSKLSYHLKELKIGGFIQECRKGIRIYYFLQPDRIKHIIDSLNAFICEHFAKFIL